ncbi:MAG TPA: symmetrical bis(5'-nucleosyl)-tetraphosphatase [Nevskiaceae bacterium]|nr:symmetrical bis(5'-nucleosyl)-tetraphosphatase [Nevskiaceae bacterium]
MTVYAIGDLQGCLDPLQSLLAKLDFNVRRDRLLLTGDLVNRGPQSLEVLRFVRSLGKAATTVLGNHDLHLLAAAESGKFGPRDTLDSIMAAPDRDELLGWLRRQPLAHEDAETGALLLHAGVAPQWTRAQTLACAAEASSYLNSVNGDRFLRKMYGNEPDRWDENLGGALRLRFIVNCLTRLRYCRVDGSIDLKHKGPPGSQPDGLLPWFEVPGRKTARDTIICGHWSSLGRVHWPQARVYGLDTGCIWGNCLTALNLLTGELRSVACTQFPKQHGD